MKYTLFRNKVQMRELTCHADDNKNTIRYEGALPIKVGDNLTTVNTDGEGTHRIDYEVVEVYPESMNGRVYGPRVLVLKFIKAIF